MGVVGAGNRGSHHIRLLCGIPGVDVRAICDLSEGAARKAAAIVREARGEEPAIHAGSTGAYGELLARGDIDAILIATPTKWHCSMAIQAMEAGKHVGSEVPAGFELDDLRALVRTKEATGRRYMLLENYIYTRENLLIYNLVRAGLLGDPYYAECGYIHDCRFMLFRADGSLDWWGEWASKNFGSDYPTHALGPVAKWLGLNDGERMEYCTSMMSAPRVLKEYAARRFGAASAQARIDWALGDFVATLIHTSAGRVIRVDYDVNSPRPMLLAYLVQGTKGIYDSREGICIEGKPETWRKTEDYRAAYDHPYWTRDGGEAARAGHGGGDFFVLRDFIEMVRLDREPWIDVYDAASWSAIFACSRESIAKRSSPVEIPDFTGGRWEDPLWRKGNLKPA